MPVQVARRLGTFRRRLRPVRGFLPAAGSFRVCRTDLDVTKVLFLIATNKRNRIPRHCGPARSAYPMNAIFHVRRHIEIHDVRDPINVDTASCDIGCDHNLKLPRLLVAEPVQNKQHKGNRLARARLGATDNISALNSSEDRLGLNFSRGALYPFARIP